MSRVRACDPRGGCSLTRLLSRVQDTASTNHIYVPCAVGRDRKGYCKDCHHAANCDPFPVMDALIRTCVLNETESEPSQCTS